MLKDFGSENSWLCFVSSFVPCSLLLVLIFFLHRTRVLFKVTHLIKTKGFIQSTVHEVKDKLILIN